MMGLSPPWESSLPVRPLPGFLRHSKSVCQERLREQKESATEDNMNVPGIPTCFLLPNARAAAAAQLTVFLPSIQEALSPIPQHHKENKS